MATPIIELSNVSKTYRLAHQNTRYLTLRDTVADAFRHPRRFFRRWQGREGGEELWALRNVSFAVQPGEVIGIIGANGAGKSTLLKILSGITPPTAGEVRLRGRVASLLEVGTGIHPELTGRENIFLHGAILGMARQEIARKFNAIVEFAGVEKFLDTPLKHYSSGMQVRLAFAVAAHLEPEILLVDEVLAVGDTEFQKKCLGKMEEVSRRQGRTIVFVSHNLTAIQALCRRVILFVHGTLVVDGDPRAVVSQYLAPYQENIFVREWPAGNDPPRNGSCRIHRVAACDGNGRPLSQIDTDTAFMIRIELETTKESAFVGLTVILYDRENRCIFSSVNNHEPDWYGKPMPRGCYQSVCKIPAGLLNHGPVRVALNLFGKNFSDARMYQQVLQFDVLDGTMVRGDYHGAFEGAVRPLLPWETVRLPLVPTGAHSRG